MQSSEMERSGVQMVRLLRRLPRRSPPFFEGMGYPACLMVRMVRSYFDGLKLVAKVDTALVQPAGVAAVTRATPAAGELRLNFCAD